MLNFKFSNDSLLLKINLIIRANYYQIPIRTHNLLHTSDTLYAPETRPFEVFNLNNSWNLHVSKEQIVDSGPKEIKDFFRKLIHTLSFSNDNNTNSQVLDVVLTKFEDWFKLQGRQQLVQIVSDFYTINKIPSPGPTNISDFALMAELLPGVNELVNYPCECDNKYPERLFTVIVHLNDTCDWTREAIADWIESLDVDTTFKVSDTSPKDLKEFAYYSAIKDVFGTTDILKGIKDE